MFWHTLSRHTKPPPIRHPWLNGGLIEHRVQSFLLIFQNIK